MNQNVACCFLECQRYRVAIVSVYRTPSTDIIMHDYKAIILYLYALDPLSGITIFHHLNLINDYVRSLHHICNIAIRAIKSTLGQFVNCRCIQ